MVTEVEKIYLNIHFSRYHLEVNAKQNIQSEKNYQAECGVSNLNVYIGLASYGKAYSEWEKHFTTPW